MWRPRASSASRTGHHQARDPPHTPLLITLISLEMGIAVIVEGGSVFRRQ